MDHGPKMWPLRGLVAAPLALVTLLAFSDGARAQGTYEILHAYTRGGIYPSGPLIQAGNGNFYGTTQSGGVTNGGTVFTITGAGIVTTLHSFDCPTIEGCAPMAGLSRAGHGLHGHPGRHLRHAPLLPLQQQRGLHPLCRPCPGPRRHLLWHDRVWRRGRRGHHLHDHERRYLHHAAFVQLPHRWLLSQGQPHPGPRRRLLRRDPAGRSERQRHDLQDHARRRPHHAALVRLPHRGLLARSRPHRGPRRHLLWHDRVWRRGRRRHGLHDHRRCCVHYAALVRLPHRRVLSRR